MQVQQDTPILGGQGAFSYIEGLEIKRKKRRQKSEASTGFQKQSIKVLQVFH